jgi:HK97 family phage portal protein
MNFLRKIFARTGSAPAPQAHSMYYGGASVAGVSVTEDSSLNYAGVWACTKIISETIAALPWKVVQTRGNFREPVSDHPLASLLQIAANNEIDAMTWRESALRDCLLWGNHYAEIEYNRRGDPVSFWRLSPADVHPARDDSGALVYEYRDRGQKYVMTADKVLHVKGPSNDGLIGLSTIQHARESIALGVAVERFGGAFFGNGAQLSGVIKNAAGGLSEEAIKNLLSSFNRRHQGVHNAHKVAYLDSGMEFQTIGVPPEDAQFLQSRKFNILDVCRWFRVPPHKLAELERSTHSNIEHQNIEFVTDALLPWIRRLESAISFKLLRQTPDIQTKISVAGLLRGDSNARAQYYNQLFQIGVLSPNQIAAFEDLPPVPDGDGHYIPLNLAPTTGGNMTDAQTLSVREVADAYTRTAANALKRVKTGEQLKAFHQHQRELFTQFFKPVARFMMDDQKTEACAAAWSDQLLQWMTSHAATNIDDSAEALRAWAPGAIVEIFKKEFANVDE